MTIYCYARFSSAKQIGGFSVEMQSDAIHQYIANHPELCGQPVTERADEGRSGTTLEKRTALQSIRQEAQRGDVVIVHKLDRLGRSLHDCVGVLRDFDERGIRVLSTTEPEARLVQHIMLSVAEEFSRSLGARCRSALQLCAANGFAANKVPFGYKLVPAGVGKRKKLELVPEEADVVRRIFCMRAKGESMRAIVVALNKEKIPSPNNSFWIIGCIQHMLHNETYIGTIFSGIREFKKGKGLLRKRPRSEWAVKRNAHPAIIDEELWRKVRNLDSSSKKRHPMTTKKRAKNLLTGFLKCSVCGGNLIVDGSKKHRYYGCAAGRDQGQYKACYRRHLVRIEVMHAAVVRALIEKVYSDEWIADVLTAFREEVKRARGSIGQVLPSLRQTLVRTERQIEAAERRLVHIPEDSVPVFIDELNRLKVERDELQAKIKAAQEATGETVPVETLESKLRERIASISKRLRGENVLQVRELLAQIVERIEVSPEREAVLYPKAGLPPPAEGVGSVGIPSRI